MHASGETVPTLFVKCRACDHEFPTRIGEPEGGPSGVIISGLKLRCPKCGHEDQYSTHDFRVPSTRKGPAPGGKSEAEPNPAAEHAAKQDEAQEKLEGFSVVKPEGRSPHEG